VREMGWCGGYRGGWRGYGYPGNGPFSYLPPWERPGFYLRYPYVPGFYQPGIGDELAYLENYKLLLENAKGNLENQLNDIEKRINDLKQRKT
jgi:hypothetical protein